MLVLLAKHPINIQSLFHFQDWFSLSVLNVMVVQHWCTMLQPMPTRSIVMAHDPTASKTTSIGPNSCSVAQWHFTTQTRESQQLGVCLISRTCSHWHRQQTHVSTSRSSRFMPAASTSIVVWVPSWSCQILCLPVQKVTGDQMEWLVLQRLSRNSRFILDCVVTGTWMSWCSSANTCLINLFQLNRPSLLADTLHHMTMDWVGSWLLLRHFCSLSIHMTECWHGRSFCKRIHANKRAEHKLVACDLSQSQLRHQIRCLACSNWSTWNDVLHWQEFLICWSQKEENRGLCLWEQSWNCRTMVSKMPNQSMKQCNCEVTSNWSCITCWFKTLHCFIIFIWWIWTNVKRSWCKCELRKLFWASAKRNTTSITKQGSILPQSRCIHCNETRHFTCFKLTGFQIAICFWLQEAPEKDWN